VVNGINEGDVLTFKLYRNGETIDLTATFDPEMPNANIFARNGLSSVVTLKAGVTSINDYTSELTVNLYPNPAKEFVNIETNFEISNLKVVNYVGQVVFDQNLEQSNYLINTSSFGPGMYFVQIQTIDGVVITKRLTVN
nr:T9SS type A sorting domain-containing protein [Bacteroidales bacterium]